MISRLETFRIRLDGQGSVECLISDGRCGATVTGAYLGDSISDLVEAIAVLLAGGTSAACEFYEEPGCYHWTLHSCEGILQIEVSWHDEEEQSETILDMTCHLAEFSSLLLREMDRLRVEWGERGYESRWGFPYPSKLVALLRARLTET